MSRLFPAAVALTLLALAPANAQDGEAKLEKIKYDQLGKVVRDLKGKVVVVDFWGTY